MDERIEKMIEAANQLKHGDFQVNVPVNPPDELGRLGRALQEMAGSLEVRYQELYRLNQQKTAFLGMAVHDLRNPLANLQLMSDVLLSDSGEPLSQAELQGFFKDIHQQSRYLSELVNDILCVAELDAGPVKLMPVEIDVAKFFLEALQRGNKLAEPKQIRLVLETEPVGKMRGDLLRLRLVIDHLLANAVRYAPLGSLVQVSAEPSGTGWRINVQDQRSEIPENDRPQLFQDFSRLSARPTGGDKSTGLGLAIARRVVEAHAGKIGADTLPGQGSIFWFEIP